MDLLAKTIITPPKIILNSEYLSRNLKVEYCASENMIADILTKGLRINRFEMLRQLAGIAESTCTD